MFRFRFLLFAAFLILFSAGQEILAQDVAPKPSKKELKELKKQERRDKKARKKAKKNGQPDAPVELDAKTREAAESLFLDGVKYSMLDDYPKALDAFKKAYELNPRNAAFNFKLAETYMQIRRDNDALPFAKTALELDPENSYYYRLLGQLYASRQQLPEASEVYVRLVNKFPEEEEYYLNLTDLYLAQNKNTEAVQTLEKAEQKFGPLDELIAKKQQLYLKQNNLAKALEEGEKLISNNPEETRFVLIQAQVLASNNKPDEAIALLSRTLRTATSDVAQMHLLLADLYRQKSQPKQAGEELRIAFNDPTLDVDTKVKILIDYIRQMPDPELEAEAKELAAMTVKAHPSEAKAYAVAGDIQAVSGDKKAARSSYAKALKFDKSHFQVWQQLIILDAELGENDSLLIHTEKATELFPSQAIVWFYNGTALLIKKNYNKAAKALEYGKKLAADTPELQMQFNLQLGDAYNSMKQYEKSNAAYESVLTLDPDNQHVLNNYSYFLSVRNQNLTKAKEMAEKLVKLAPAESTYLDTYAWVLYKLKDYENAKTNLEKALETSKDGTVVEHYGDVLYQMGLKDEALQQWHKAKKTGGASDLIDKKIRDKKLYE
jgi:tetratricopeptide (TPR) repeat protein